MNADSELTELKVFSLPCSSQAAFDLPKVVKFDPYAPRISLDSERVIAVQSFASALQDSLVLILSQPFEDRMTLLKPGKSELEVFCRSNKNMFEEANVLLFLQKRRLHPVSVKENTVSSKRVRRNYEALLHNLSVNG